MPRIRKLEIRNFRSIALLDWCPGPGINCLVGPGDSGKTTILDAIALCLGAGRPVTVADDDFHNLQVDKPINITVTLGDLSDRLLSFDAYGMYLRGFDARSREIEDEPGKGLENVLSVQVEVGPDLEPQRRLVSERATAQGAPHDLARADRARLAPTRLGGSGDYHLRWSRGSLLSKISGETVNAAAAIAAAARDARGRFGDSAHEQLAVALESTKKIADRLGVPVGDAVNALLALRATSFASGAVSLHDSRGVPLRGLGLGSVRLLVTGLQRHAAAESPMILIDELEHGLEPHRIVGLLTELGAKEANPPLQAFVTTHSPVVVCELDAAQLHIVRPYGTQHCLVCPDGVGGVQGTIRRSPEALLAKAVLVCEGASEVGLVRGLDRHRQVAGHASVTAKGVALVDGGGHTTLERALAFSKMRYRTAVLLDSDRPADSNLKTQFEAAGGTVFGWQQGRALEDELFHSLAAEDLSKLLDYAIELKGEPLVAEHIRSASSGTGALQDIQANPTAIVPKQRSLLGQAAKSKRNAWFKSVTAMEEVAANIVGPGYDRADTSLRAVLDAVFAWIENA